MPRPKRICIPGLPHHVVQRGNNKHATFFHKNDYNNYLALLSEASAKHNVMVHAFVLMTNHVHLLMTPSCSNGLSLTMQDLGRRFVTYINKTYERTGTLWEGRFKCSVIDSERYCLECYRYIDLNPSRAGMVKDPVDYRWSSYRHNAMGAVSNLLTPHDSYVQLGTTNKTRTARYRDLIAEVLDDESLSKIRYGVKKGLPVGSERFKSEVEKYLGQRLGSGKIGRPAKH
jgi:putative transposase